MAFSTSSRVSVSPSSPDQRRMVSITSSRDMPRVEVISWTHISTTYSRRPLHPASFASAINDTITPARSGSAHSRRADWASVDTAAPVLDPGWLSTLHLHSGLLHWSPPSARLHARQRLQYDL